MVNLIVIETIWRTPSLGKKLYYKGLLSLSVTDLLSASVSAPMAGYCYWSIVSSDLQAEELCKIWKVMIAFAYVLTGLSLNGTVCIAIERYFKICHATKYQDIVTNKRVLSVILMLYGVTVAWATAFVSKDQTRILGYLFITGLIACILGAAFMYHRIFATIRISQARVNCRSPEDSYRAREQRLAKTFILIIAALVVCFMPHCVFRILSMKRYREEWFHFTFGYTFYFGFFNSFLNPCLYIWQDSAFKKCVFSRISIYTRKSLWDNRDKQRIDKILSIIDQIDLLCTESYSLSMT